MYFWTWETSSVYVHVQRQSESVPVVTLLLLLLEGSAHCLQTFTLDAQCFRVGLGSFPPTFGWPLGS